MAITIHSIREKAISLIDSIETKEDPRVKELTNLTKELIELLILSLLKESDNFFGNTTVLLNRKIDYTLGAPAAVGLKSSVFTLYVNPLQFCPRTIEEMKKIMIHECHHIIKMHLTLFRDEFAVNPLIVNIGTDCNINQEIGLSEPFITLDSVRRICDDPSIRAKEESRYYYNELMKAKKNNPSEPDSSECSGGGEGKGDPQFMKEADPFQMHKFWKEVSEVDADNIKEITKNILGEASSNSRGQIPGSVTETLERLNAPPKVDFRVFIRKQIGRIPIPYKKTIMRRSRTQPNRLDLRGRLSDHILNIYFALDDSGSMSEDDIAYGLNEVAGNIKYLKSKITILEFDSKVQKEYVVKTARDVQYRVTGRGGTCYQSVLDYIKEKKDLNSLVIFFTDGGGESEIVKPVGLTVAYIVIGSWNLSVSEPQGDVFYLRDDDKYNKLKKK